MKKTRHARRFPPITLAALLVAGCGAAGTASPATPQATPTPPSGATPAPPPTAAPTATAAPASTPPEPTAVPTTAATPGPFTCGAIVHQPGTVPIARITGLTVVDDAGTGRITFTFAPAGNVAAVPEVEIRPADPPFTRDHSGLPLEVAGRKHLQLVLQGGTALDDNFNPTYGGPFDFTTGGMPIVEMKRAGDFEAVSTFVVGVSGVPCVRILPLDGSSRLVIEIQATTSG